MVDVTISDAGLMGMITLRGDHAALKAVCTQITGAAFPAMGRIEAAGDNALAWMSPDEVLVMMPHSDVPAALVKIANALQGVHHLVVDVSDARALFAVSGSYASEVIAKLAPVDMHPDHFGPGQFRRSRLGQVAAAFWMTPDRTIHVICFRSVTDYVSALLEQSARDGAVGFFHSSATRAVPAGPR
jgi:sarcosine oxidase, subunit gamma